ncbi:MAG: hypothetical protein WC570_02650 [Patescibacteria group bacterium]
MLYTILSWALSIWGLLAVIGLVISPIIMIVAHKKKKSFTLFLIVLIGSLVSLPIVFALYAILVTITKNIIV